MMPCYQTVFKPANAKPLNQNEQQGYNSDWETNELVLPPALHFN
jgi:hypothetical protein